MYVYCGQKSKNMQTPEYGYTVFRTGTCVSSRTRISSLKNRVCSFQNRKMYPQGQGVSSRVHMFSFQNRDMYRPELGHVSSKTRVWSLKNRVCLVSRIGILIFQNGDGTLPPEEGRVTSRTRVFRPHSIDL